MCLVPCLGGAGGCGMRCVCSALSPGQRVSLECPPTDAEGLSSVARRVGCLMTLRSCNIASAVTCRHGPQELGRTCKPGPVSGTAPSPGDLRWASDHSILAEPGLGIWQEWP